MRPLCARYAPAMRPLCVCYAAAMLVYAVAGVCLVVGPLCCSASGAPADPSSAATLYSKVTSLSAIEPS